jgi:hypothetical protein
MGPVCGSGSRLHIGLPTFLDSDVYAWLYFSTSNSKRSIWRTSAYLTARAHCSIYGSQRYLYQYSIRGHFAPRFKSGATAKSQSPVALSPRNPCEEALWVLAHKVLAGLVEEEDTEREREREEDVLDGNALMSSQR